MPRIGVSVLLSIAASFLPIAATSAEDARRSIAGFSSLPDAEKTEILVLATPHLANHEGLSQADAEPVIDVLANWQPAAVGIERIGHREIELMLADPAHAETLETYIGGEKLRASKQAQSLTGLSSFDADDVIGGWTGPADDPAANGERVAVALAAYEYETALLYWRRAGRPQDGMSEEALDLLRGLDASLNERVSLAVVLAERLGLPRIWPIDSHMDSAAFGRIAGRLQRRIEESGSLAELMDTEYMLKAAALIEEAEGDGDLLPVYRFLNSSAYAAADMRAQFDIWNRIPIEGEFGRMREAYWDERNFRIAANIRRMSASHVDQRLVVIIGAGHKPFLDELLAATLDVDVAEMEFGLAK